MNQAAAPPVNRTEGSSEALYENGRFLKAEPGGARKSKTKEGLFPARSLSSERKAETYHAD